MCCGGGVGFLLVLGERRGLWGLGVLGEEVADSGAGEGCLPSLSSGPSWRLGVTHPRAVRGRTSIRGLRGLGRLVCGDEGGEG